MSRIGWLAILAVALVGGPATAQFGGMGGGGFGGPGQEARSVHRVEVEAAGGKRLSGPLRMGTIVIEGEFGRYDIKPEKVREIRLEPGREPSPMIVGVGGVQGLPVTGTVVATSGEEIAGTLIIPQDWTITTDLGTVTLAPSKLTTITFLDEPRAEDPPKPAEGDVGRREEAPQIMRDGDTLWAVSPSGHKVAVKVAGSDETETLELPASEEAPLRVTWLRNAAGLSALHLEGPEVTRIAVFNLVDGKWHPQDLREPVEKASPIVSNATVAYHLGPMPVR